MELMIGGVNVTDWFLLRKFKDDRSQSAFAEIVDRYINLVYAACYANLQDRQAAEDATQAVFLILARKAEFRRGSTMVGWLFRTARYVSMHARRDEIRRRKLQAAVALQHDHSDSQPWSRLDTRLILNDAIERLGDVEREAVLLRYYQAMPLKDVGEALGISEEAARKRIDRGVDKLRRYLAGVDTVAAGIVVSMLVEGHAAGALTEIQNQELAHLIASNASAFHATAITSAHQLTTEVLRNMLITKLRVAAVLITVTVVGGTGTAYVWGHAPTGRGHDAIAQRPMSIPSGDQPTLSGGYPGQPPADPNSERQRQQALQTKSVDRLKRIGLAIIEVMTPKHPVRGQVVKAAFPNLDWHALHETLRPYVKSDQDFFQPGVSQPYHFNIALSHTQLAAITNPALVPLAYETAPSPDGRLNVLFVDGHVQSISIEEWKTENPDFNPR